MAYKNIKNCRKLKSKHNYRNHEVEKVGRQLGTGLLLSSPLNVVDTAVE